MARISNGVNILKRTLVIIPTYNEKNNIRKLFSEIFNLSVKLDILVIDDNSPDGTGELVKTLEKKNPRLKLISRSRKSGLGSAYMNGFEFALKNKYDYVISMDADFSHDPKIIPLMLKYAPDYDLVIGSRYIEGGEIIGWERYRYFLSRIANFFARLLLGLKFRDVTSGFKCYSKKLLENLIRHKIISPGYVFQVETIFRAQNALMKILETPIIFCERRRGKSKISRKEIFGGLINLLKLTWQRRGIQQIIKFSLVGAANTLVDLGFLNFFVLVLGLNVYLSGILAVLIAITNSYFWNKKWTFRGLGKKQQATEITQFFLVMGSGALLNIGIYSFLISYFGLWYNWAKLLAIAVVVLWNFTLSKYWVFKP